MIGTAASATDPDNTRTVIFGVGGSFPGNSNLASYRFGSTNANEVTLTYTPPATNPATVDLTGSKPFGTLTFTPTRPNQFAGFTIIDPGVDFYLTVTQSAPYPATSAAPLTLALKCKIKGVISPTAANNTVQLVFPNLSNNLGGVGHVRTTSTGTVAQPLSYASATAVAPSAPRFYST